MDRPLLSSTDAEIFDLRLPAGRPSSRNLFFSLILHAALVTAIFNITLPDTGYQPKPTERISPTELRLDGHLYYVAKIPIEEKDERKTDAPKKFDPTKLTLPRAAESGKQPAPAPRALPKPPDVRITAAIPATPDAADQLAATRQLVKRELARTFVPPQVKRDRNATQTLIQPLSPPDLVPPPTPLPTFRVSSPALPRIPKPFLAPGRKTPTPPAQVPNVAAPNIELVHADPVLADVQPKLPLPATPPPPEPVQAKVEGPPPAPQGDPVNILSLSDRPIRADKPFTVPAGNIAQEAGDAAAAQPGSATASAGTSASGANSNVPPRAAPTGAGGSSSAANNPNRAGAGTSPNGSPRALAANSGAANSGAANANGGTGAGGAGNSASGAGRGTIGSGPGAAIAGASATGDTNAIAGSTNPNPGATGAGTGAGTGGGTGSGRVINRSPAGNYDAVVIQASPVDQYPETRGLLSGRPIYAVYIAAGGARDWTLYYCVPNDKAAPGNGSVVEIGPSPAPLGAPYPFKIVRPAVALPSWEKYVLVHGYVTVEGRFQDIRIVRSILPETDQAILASMTDWQFRAATKDGVPVRVEFLLSIPAKGL